jgi:hypothetical protein
MTPASNGGTMHGHAGWTPDAAEALRPAVVRFMDDLRAAESAAVEVFEAWLGACQLAGLRGALRTIAAREATHAELLAARLAELGITPAATLDGEVRAAAVAHFASSTVPDDEKLALFLARYPDDRAAARPFDAFLADGAEGDPETRELLALVADAEVATVSWLRAYLAGLGNGVRR